MLGGNAAKLPLLMSRFWARYLGYKDSYFKAFKIFR